MTNIIQASHRFNKETSFWKDYKALSGVLTINEALALYYSETTHGRKEALAHFNPDF